MPSARPDYVGAGALLLVLAALVSGTSMEQWLGRAPHSLTWGPALFRVLLAMHGLVLIAVSFIGKKRPRPALLPAIHNRVGLTLALLSAVALALRIPGLNSCMWLDEVLTMVRFARPPLSSDREQFP